MREILFRAKAIENDQWVEGYFVHVPCGRFLSDEHLIQTIEEDGRIGQLHTVYASSVGQFTGLKDTKGKKIFEGDILQYWNRYKGKYEGTCVVKYGEFNCSCCDGVYGWYLEDGDIRYLEDETYLLYEVRGNIYDNPKLLKEGE